MPFTTRTLPEVPDDIAPDGSQIHLLPGLPGVSLCHCSLPAGGITRAFRHRLVSEIWYFIEGCGQVWREMDGNDEITPVTAGLSLSIPLGTSFQFRHTGREPLTFIIATQPSWSGPNEAIPVPGTWVVTARHTPEHRKHQ
jgi:mannose-6-phosphate isomerase-like protein (cupin superfamily)